MTTPADDAALPAPRVAGAGLLVSALLLAGGAVAVAVEDRSALLTLLIVFALVSVPALVAAAVALPLGVALLRGRGEDRTTRRTTAVCAGLLALGHLGLAVVALRPGLDRALDDGDLAAAGAAAAGMAGALTALGLALPGRSTGLRVVGALLAGLVLLSLVALRAVAQTG